MRNKTFFLALCGIFLTACTERVVYQADVPVPGGDWSRAFVPEFAFDMTDALNKHDLYIDIRHTGEYPYSDLFLFVELSGPDGRHMRDTVECLLADPTGRWFGKGTGFIFADRYQAKVLYKLGNRFPVTGRYGIKLEQAMRADQLPGVLDVGISVERSR